MDVIFVLQVLKGDFQRRRGLFNRVLGPLRFTFVFTQEKSVVRVSLTTDKLNVYGAWRVSKSDGISQ